MNEQLLMKLYKIINTVIKDKNLPACLLENISSCQFPSMTYLGSGVASRENDGRTDQNPVYPRLHLSFVFAGGPVYEPSE